MDFLAEFADYTISPLQFEKPTEILRIESSSSNSWVVKFFGITVQVTK